MKKLFGAVRYQWISPLLVFFSGLIYLIKAEPGRTIATFWWVLTPLAFLLMVLGIYRHILYARTKKESLLEKK